ncbi:hypothetical protein ACQ4N7_13790 [Nodosilinea sp. AN01ver1]|uniref:hypothetical protein n=1 Tax=Nodosilinea sp. AN01ver1 TaxID=3423362 RepID=UPI003D323281
MNDRIDDLINSVPSPAVRGLFPSAKKIIHIALEIAIKNNRINQAEKEKAEEILERISRTFEE